MSSGIYIFLAPVLGITMMIAVVKLSEKRDMAIAKRSMDAMLRDGHKAS